MSTIKADNIATLAGVSTSMANAVNGSAKAWVNFDGKFGTSPFTIANGGIRAAHNVSSVTDNGVGQYLINFTSGTFSDANYVCVISGYDVPTGGTAIKAQAGRYVSASSQPVYGLNAAGTSFADLDQMHVAFFR